MNLSLDQVVDLERYPIDEPLGRGRGLVESCRNELVRSALCTLPGFLKPKALDAIRDEIGRCEQEVWPIESTRTLYSWRDLSALSPEHPARVGTRHKLGSITRDSFDEDGVLLRLFNNDRLTEFVRSTLGFEQLHRVECPWLSMNVKVMGKGDIHGWHFDSNDGAVSLLVQASTAGGGYEYVPYIRSDDDENYDRVSRIAKGESTEGVVKVDIEPGTFCLFNGYRSLHRVSEVTQGESKRLVALFAYDREPGIRYNESTLKTVLGGLPDGFDDLPPPRSKAG